MKILVVTPTFFPIMGGAELGIYELFRRLSSKHEIKIFTPWPDKSLVEEYGMEKSEIDLNNIGVVRFNDRVNLKKWPDPWLLKGIIPPFSFSSIWSLRKLLKYYKPDIINVFYPLPMGLSALYLEKIIKIPVVLSLVGRDVPGPNLPRFWSNYTRTITRLISQKIFISDYCRKALFNTNTEEGIVIPFGIDVDKYNPDIDGSSIRRKLSIPKEALVLFALQRLDKWKRVDVIIKALKSVLKRKDVFLLIGGKGPENNYLNQMTKDLGISSRVIFAGFIPENELPIYYATADLFVFHSIYETLGLVLLQAMASGKPIVSVESTAIPEVIDNHKNGILVEPLNPEQFADAIIYLLENKDIMKIFSQNSRKTALEKYDWNYISKRYEEIFLKCIG